MMKQGGIAGATRARLARHDGRARAMLLAAAGLVLGISVTLPSPIGRDVPPAAAPPPGEPIVPIPAGPMLDPGRVALGERLFHDVRLSRDGRRACATCHPLDRGGMDGQPRARMADGSLHARNTPTIFNVGLSAFFNWDGVARTLEEHAEIVLLNPSLMNTTWPDLLARLRDPESYRAEFERVYDEGPTRRTVLDALASFERSLQTPNARFDRYLRGEATALDPVEQRGYQRFKAYGCGSCHQGVNVGGNMFQKFGVFPAGPGPFRLEADQGRYQVTSVPRDRGVFRVPSLRNVAATGPYFHDGRTTTLEGAVETMATVQLGRRLEPEDVESIARFLRTLTGEYQGRPVASAAPPGPAR
jgi:cytochrome c peroxidase